MLRIFMKGKRTVLWCCLITALAFVLILYTFWDKQEDDFVLVHTQKVSEYVASLRGQSLEETFFGLLDNQQYFYPGYHPEAEGAPREMEELLSSRGFLKVFQQFGELPKEQAAEKIHLFRDRAFKEFSDSLEQSVARAADPLLWDSETMEPVPTPNVMGAKYMVCATMLLVARIGEYKMLLDQIEAMETLANSYVERVRKYNPPEPGWDAISRSIASLEDDCILSVLIYALKQKGTDLETDVPLDQKIVPLFRWDAELTYYDVLAQRGFKNIAPQDAVESFTVYAFQKDVEDQQRRHIIATLKERLSR